MNYLQLKLYNLGRVEETIFHLFLLDLANDLWFVDRYSLHGRFNLEIKLILNPYVKRCLLMLCIPDLPQKLRLSTTL